MIIENFHNFKYSDKYLNKKIFHIVINDYEEKTRRIKITTSPFEDSYFISCLENDSICPYYLKTLLVLINDLSLSFDILLIETTSSYEANSIINALYQANKINKDFLFPYKEELYEDCLKIFGQIQIKNLE